jgi:hypothetical protein
MDFLKMLNRAFIHERFQDIRAGNQHKTYPGILCF